MSAAPEPHEALVAEFTLSIGGRVLETTARLPAGEVRLVDLLPTLHRLGDDIVALAVDQAREKNRAVSCRMGCAACCRQIVSISEAEALALLEWIETRPPEEQKAIRARFDAAVSALAAKGMLEPTRQSVAITGVRESVTFALQYHCAGVACPFLVNEACSIYPIRPMKCREYLVTSPAAHCSAPTPETVAMIQLPAALSKTLFQFQPGENRGPVKWIPLVLLFEHADALRALPQPKAAGLRLFQQFLAAMLKAKPEALDEFFAPPANTSSRDL